MSSRIPERGRSSSIEPRTPHVFPLSEPSEQNSKSEFEALFSRALARNPEALESLRRIETHLDKDSLCHQKIHEALIADLETIGAHAIEPRTSRLFPSNEQKSKSDFETLFGNALKGDSNSLKSLRSILGDLDKYSSRHQQFREALIADLQTINIVSNSHRENPPPPRNTASIQSQASLLLPLKGKISKTKYDATFRSALEGDAEATRKIRNDRSALDLKSAQDHELYRALTVDLANIAAIGNPHARALTPPHNARNDLPPLYPMAQPPRKASQDPQSS